MKRFVSLVVICCISLCLFGSFTVNATSADSSETVTSGVALSADKFATVFSGNPKARSMGSRDALVTADLVLTNVVISENTVAVNAAVRIGENFVVLPISGELKDSNKIQNGVNSVIVQVEDLVNGYEVLLFEIFNDTGHDTLLLNGVGTGKSLDGAPHIKLYLKDAAGMMYFFEEELPHEFAGLRAGTYGKASSKKDGLWAYPYVQHYFTEIDTASLQDAQGDAQSKAILPPPVVIEDPLPDVVNTWRNPTIYSVSYYISNDYFEHFSRPCVEFEFTDVSTVHSFWTATFKVDESTVVTCATGDTIVQLGNNPFEYHNLELSFACGDKSTFLETYRQGQFFEENDLLEILRGWGDDIVAIAIEHTLNAAAGGLPVGSFLSAALALIDSASSTNKTVYMGSPNITMYNGTNVTAVVGEKPEGVYFKDCSDQNGVEYVGHYYMFRGTLKYRNIEGNTDTVGALRFKVDVRDVYSYELTPIQKDFRLVYSAEP